MKNFKLTRQNTFEEIEKMFSDTDVNITFETNDFGLILFHHIIETWVENLGDWVTKEKELKEPAEKVEQQYAKYTLIGGKTLTLIVNPNIEDTSEKDYAEYFYLKQ